MGDRRCSPRPQRRLAALGRVLRQGPDMLSIDWTSEEPAPEALQLLAVAVTGDSDAVERRFGAAVARAATAARFAGRGGEKYVFTRESGGALQSVALLG